MMRIGISTLPAAHFVLAILALPPRLAHPQGGDPLGPEFRVNSYTTNGQEDAHVAADPSGNFVVVWTSGQYGPTYRAVMAQRFDAGGSGLGPEFRVNTFANGGPYAGDVGSDASGNFVVVWTSIFQDGADAGVFGQRFAATGVPLGPEFRVNTYTAGSEYASSVAVDPSGNFVVTSVSDHDGAGFGIFGQRFASSGVPLGAEFRVNTFTSSLQTGGDVAYDAAGNFVVVWNSGWPEITNFSVFGQRFAGSGAPLGPEFRVNTYTTGNQLAGKVAFDPDGNFVVVWQSDGEDGELPGIFGQRFAASGVPAGSEFRVNTYTTHAQRYPSIASDPAGNFIVVWSSYTQDGSLDGVFGQRYATGGTPMGPEFRVTTYTTNPQQEPDVSADAAGNFVVVWESVDQDGDGRGVFGQRFGRIVPVDLMRFRVE